MIRQHRPKAPDWLQENSEKWGKQYEAKVKNPKKNNQFSWPTHNQEKVNQKLLPLLKEMTHEHCSFCDAFPVGRRLEATIDHFRPKTLFPLLVCEWTNLFLCCRLCQRKFDRFEEALLKPDEEGYSFERYFLFNYQTGEIEVNPRRPAEDQYRANITIELFRLNENEKPIDRLEVLNTYISTPPTNRDRYLYRFMY